MAHGDFYFRNIVPNDSQVTLVDWEYAGPAAELTDHLRLWSTQKDPADRSVIWEHLMFRADASKRRNAATLARWLGYRLWAENLTAPPRDRNRADLSHARTVAREGAALAAHVGL